MPKTMNDQETMIEWWKELAKKNQAQTDEALKRIAKTREILELIGLDSENSWARIKAKEALDALEGK